MFILVLMSWKKKSYNEKVATANKLHRQFGHSTSEKLKKLIKSSKRDDRELLEIIHNK